ncbi:MAG: hypothetical protein FWF88_11695 [Peptococcaceae bacterium]|nr:hypothetical protein [Peptococcaceae bacterium]
MDNERVLQIRPQPEGREGAVRHRAEGGRGVRRVRQAVLRVGASLWHLRRERKSVS